ncbi:MAG: M14 family metallopeptidase [Anaerolineales bacterium]|nr:M14 family metallopeptidase [Anaerolineales bacterium]
MNITFPSSYEDSRARFIRDFELLRPKWNSSRLESVPLKTESSLSIDYAWAEPRKKENLIVISTGLHGIEGYVGSVMLKIFMDEFAPRLNLENTGLLLVHAINPYGMKNRRRYNENNADLNRNFVWDENFDPKINPDYEPLTPLLNPARPITNLFASDVAFFSRLIGRIVKLGILRIRQGTLSGQYRHPRGVQFGGQSTQESTQVMRGLFQRAFDEYEQVIHLDMHTGYGPRYQMSMVNSTREPASGPELTRRFNYPLIVAATPSDFYSVTGDITEYFYQLRDEKYPSKKLFATCFEFGTFGAALPNQIRSMRATILENRLFQFGAKSDALRNMVRNEYEELFFPAEPKWRAKAMADCRQAFEGIFTAYGAMR